MRRLQRSDATIAIALAISTFLLYLRTLAPGVVDADGGEFQFAAWNFSFVHPTGYPLFLLLGGIAQHLLPVGDPAYRLNVFTALTAALAVAAIYLAVMELTLQKIAAIVASLSFALTRTFWFDAGAAEVYDLNAFFLALLLFLAVRWQTSTGARTFGAFCFVYGLALTHHRTIILWAPAFALFFIIAGWRSRLSLHASRMELSVFGNLTGLTPINKLRACSRLALPAFFLFLFPFLLYLYIPLRAPSSPYAVLSLAPGRTLVLYDNSIGGLLDYVFGRAFQNELGWDATSLARLGMLTQRWIDQFSIIGIFVGLFGLGVMTARKEWARLALLVGGTISTVLFSSLYHIGDIAHYYIPAYLVWAVWIGVGLAGLGSFIDRRWTKDEGRTPAVSRRRSAVAPVFSTFVAMSLLVPQLTANFHAADRSHETQAREQWEQILAAPIPPNAILLSNDRDEMMPLWYIQYVENRRRDLLGLFPLITPSPEHANIVRLIDSLSDTNRPLFLVKPMPGLEIKFHLINAQASLVKVEGRLTDAPPRFASNAVLGDRIRVIGYDAVRQDQSLRVAIYWQPFDRLEYNYATFVHLVDERGQKVAQGTDHQVGGDYYPTSLWEVGQVLRDEQIVALPPGLTPKEYRLVAGMYRQPDLSLGEPISIGKIDLR